MSTRKRTRRRDRRKAKQTGYRRAGKQMGVRVGHGVSGSPGGPRQLRRVSKRKPLLPDVAQPRSVPAPKHGARATIAEIIASKRP